MHVFFQYRHSLRGVSARKSAGIPIFVAHANAERTYSSFFTLLVFSSSVHFCCDNAADENNATAMQIAVIVMVTPLVRLLHFGCVVLVDEPVNLLDRSWRFRFFVALAPGPSFVISRQRFVRRCHGRKTPRPLMAGAS